MLNRLVIAAALLSAVLLALSYSLPAHAHTMDRRTAANEGWLALSDWADEHEHWDEYVSDIDLTRRDCFRDTRHQWECIGGVDFSNTEESYLDRFCTATVRVRYASRRSWRIRTRVFKVTCF